MGDPRDAPMAVPPGAGASQDSRHPCGSLRPGVLGHHPSRGIGEQQKDPQCSQK